MPRHHPPVWSDACPENGWHAFSLQEQAFAFADEADSRDLVGDRTLHVWALELDKSGRRRYYVASQRDFWRRYKMLRCDTQSRDVSHTPSCFRHHYEVIREGTPCHLHVDLEFATAPNPHVDGERMVARLRREIISTLGANYGIAAAACDVVDLDSSTPSKFSRHVLVRIDGAAFADNAECGGFVQACCEALHVRSFDDEGLAELWVRPPTDAVAPPTDDGASVSSASDEASSRRPGPSPQPELSSQPKPPPQAAPPPPRPELATLAAPVCFVDLGIYTRNRCFRLFKSAKRGKRRADGTPAQLLPAASWMAPEQFWHMSHADETKLFHRTLVTDVTSGCRLLHWPPVTGDNDGDGAAAAALATNAAPAQPLPRTRPGHPRSSAAAAAAATARSGRGGPGACPPQFAPLQAFMLRAWACKSGAEARVRSWAFDATRLQLTLTLGTENRWCAHVQRFHRSNGNLGMVK